MKTTGVGMGGKRQWELSQVSRFGQLVDKGAVN